MFPGYLQPPVPTIPPPGPMWPYGDMIPVGAVMPFAGDLSDGTEEVGKTSVESWGWMSCDGRELEVSAYPQLHAALGFRYGGGGEKFKIPDYRGLFMRAVDGGSGNDPDSAERKAPEGGAATEVGSTQEDALQTHEHIYKAAPAPAAPGPPGTAAGSPAGQPTLTEQGPTSALAPPGEVRVSEKETRAKNIYVHYIIKYAYLSRSSSHAPNS
ncbi:MAG: phage tail protein [Acidobacteriota bacterium]|nr:phage tail protein [Acidobacteriota bacterium]